MMNKSNTFMPPLQNGIGASVVFAPKSLKYKTIFEFFSTQFSHISTQEWQRRFDDGLVFNQEGEKLNTTQMYQGEQHLYYYRHLPYEAEIPFEHKILFENEHFIVVDKPHFLTVSPTGQYVQQTLLTRLKRMTNNAALTPIHRLDRETAGLILISKQMTTRGIYQQLFAQQQIQKTYHAIAASRPELNFPLCFSACMQKGEPFYTMKIIEGISNSTTDIAILEQQGRWAKYELKPVTGKQHQLRVHMNALGIALKNDRFYPVVQHIGQDDFSAPLQLLAKYLDFIDPITGQNFSFCSSFDLLLPRE